MKNNAMCRKCNLNWQGFKINLNPHQVKPREEFRLAVKADIVIIGGGLAGLTAAAVLCGQGHSLALVEQDQDLGGRLRSISRDGYRLDAGLHCFHYGEHGPLGELNQSLGLDLSFLHDRLSTYILEGKDRLIVPAEADTDPSDVPGFTPKQAARIRKWFSGVMETDPAPWKEKTVTQFLDESAADDKLVRSYAGALCLSLLGQNPDRVSAGLLIEHSRAVGHPGFHVASIAGGPGKLIDALTNRIGADHVSVRLGSKVDEIEIEDKQVRRVVTASEEYYPNAVIYAAPVQHLPALFGGDKVSGSFKRSCRRTEPVAGIAIELGLTAPVSTIKGVMVDPEEGVIGRFPSNLDPSLAPEGGQISSWLALVPPDDLQDVKLARGHIMRLRRVIKRQFPELVEVVKWERLRVIPLLAGAAPTPAQATEKKLAPTVKGVNNLFLAGDAVGAAGILSGAAVSSALKAAELAQEYLAAREAKKAKKAGKVEAEKTEEALKPTEE